MRQVDRVFSSVELPAVSERKRGAFTLVELLVVIGIIALLVSILMPALAKARYQAQETVCMSNVRQQALSLLMYTNDNKGWFPQHHDPYAMYVQSPGNPNKPANCLNSMKGRYIRDARILICPIVAALNTDSAYESPDWTYDAVPTYGGWNTDALFVLMAYEWFTNYTSSRAGPPPWIYLNGEKPWADRIHQAKSDVAIITHQIYEDSVPGWDLSHSGHGRVARKNTRSTPVGFGDGHVEIRQKDEIKPRVIVGPTTYWY